MGDAVSASFRTLEIFIFCRLSSKNYFVSNSPKPDVAIRLMCSGTPASFESTRIYVKENQENIKL
jgi:tRNA pseudouridine-54 N-methylase